MDKYGWIVALERAPHLDEAPNKIFTVNLVRPWCDEEVPAEPRGPGKPGALDMTGDLWLPWRWETPIDWAVYGRFDDAGKPVWKKIDAASVKSPEASAGLKQHDDTVDAIDQEIRKATANTQYPFSQLPEDLQTTEARSLVHVLAPLTHWPARLSGGVLRLTWLMSCPSDAFENCQLAVCFPQFKMRPGTLVAGATQEPDAATLDDFGTFSGKQAVRVDYLDQHVSFLALAADLSVADSVPAEGKLQLAQGSVSRSALAAYFVENLLPLPILRTWIEKASDAGPLATANAQSSLVRALWAALGFGREYVDGTARTNIVEFLVDGAALADARTLRSAIEREVEKIDSAAAMARFRGAVEQLAAAPLSRAWAVEQQSTWKLVQEMLESFDTAPLPAPVFRANWIQIAAVLTSEEGLRAVMGPWLARILDGLFVTTEERNAWTPVGKKLERVGEFRADLLLRAWPYTGRPAHWEAAGELARKMDEATTKELARTTLEAAGAVLGGTWPGLESELDAAVTKRIQRFVQQVVGASNADRPRPRDRGLKLDFSALDASSGPDSDHRLRGYAIGLCSGYIARGGGKWMADDKRAQWLTDTAVQVRQAWAEDEGGGIAWMHEAVGATSANGEKLVSVEFEGTPVATTLAAGDQISYDDGDPDGFQQIDFGWNDQDRPLPLLGYGLYYAAWATPLDNVGAVIDEKMRGRHVTELKPAGEVQAAHAQTLQYLSSEAPGAPDCSMLDENLYALSEETQAHAWQAWDIAKAADAAAASGSVRVPVLAKVALLAKPQMLSDGAVDHVLFPDAESECRFTVRPHGTHSAFIKRWLATDRLLVENGEVPSDMELGKDAEAIATFAATFRERPGARTQRATPYHPAVRAIGIALVLHGKTVHREIVEIERVKRDAGGVLAAAQGTACVEVRVVAVDSGSPRLKAYQRSVTLDLPRGAFACLRFYALVDDRHFTSGSSDQRYAEGLRNTTEAGFAGFRAFSPSERWFETLPEWPTNGLPGDPVVLGLTPPAESAAGLVSPNLLVADIQFPTATGWAQWIKGAYLQRHEWHWTGYPVEFPDAASELPAWIPSLAGVESFREAIEATFTTSFDGAEWRLGIAASGKVAVHRWPLAAGARPARYVAYLARPMLRFRPWLNPKLGEQGPYAVERDIYARGALVPGRLREGPFERLATPSLREGIPLTATYGDTFRRRQNGAMLVFDDVIRRTDDLAHVGGLGDSIEIDLVETRFADVSEMGNNPIFHGVGRQPSNWGLSVDGAFGLTFDTGPNPKVAQTAIIVRPVNAGGRWVMAMVRARRFILPETELGTMLRAGGTGHLAMIPTRVAGKDMVPLDFVVDVDAPLQRPLRLFVDSPAPKELEIAVPATAPSGAKYRYLVTWHKGRWKKEDDPKDDATDDGQTWRCQVMLQTRRDARLAWETQPGTVSCFQNRSSTLKPGSSIERWYLAAGPEAKDPEVRRIRISDYTDPRWLTFIGSFGNEMPAMADDCRFVVRDGKLDKLEAAPDSKAQLPTLRNRDASLTGDEPTFHLALVFREVPDAVRLRTEKGTGELVACYFVDSGKKPVFLPRTAKDKEPASFKDCYAHILALQRSNSLTSLEKEELKAGTLSGLLECAFPPQGDTAKECILRFLPEHIGPIPIRN